MSGLPPCTAPPSQATPFLPRPWYLPFPFPLLRNWLGLCPLVVLAQLSPSQRGLPTTSPLPLPHLTKHPSLAHSPRYAHLFSLPNTLFTCPLAAFLLLLEHKLLEGRDFCMSCSLLNSKYLLTGWVSPLPMSSACTGVFAAVYFQPYLGFLFLLISSVQNPGSGSKELLLTEFLLCHTWCWTLYIHQHLISVTALWGGSYSSKEEFAQGQS